MSDDEQQQRGKQMLGNTGGCSLALARGILPISYLLSFFTGREGEEEARRQVGSMSGDRKNNTSTWIIHRGIIEGWGRDRREIVSRGGH